MIPDALYEEAGATVSADRAAVWGAPLVVKVAPPSDAESARLARGAVLVAFLDPLGSPRGDARARRRRRDGVRDGGDPADLARAVDGRAVLAVERRRLPRGAARRRAHRPLLPDADDRGRDDPAGEGARPRAPASPGLQALATARRLGAQTTGYDVRPEVAEQVRSLGAKWLDLGIEAAGEGGYARELTDEEKAAQQQALTDAIKGFDVVITTALVPGPPGAEARHRRGGRGDEAGQRDRRPRRRDRRQLRADRARAR